MFWFRLNFIHSEKHELMKIHFIKHNTWLNVQLFFSIHHNVFLFLFCLHLRQLHLNNNFLHSFIFIKLNEVLRGKLKILLLTCGYGNVCKYCLNNPGIIRLSLTFFHLSKSKYWCISRPRSTTFVGYHLCQPRNRSNNIK